MLQTFIISASRTYRQWWTPIGTLLGSRRRARARFYTLLAEGAAKGKAEAILAVLEARGLNVPPHTRKRVLACSDPETLDGWLRHAAVVSSARELFGSPRRDRSPRVRRPLVGLTRG